MEEDLTILNDSAKNCNVSVILDDKEKVKDFVYKHFREVTTDGSLFNNAEEPPIKEHGSSTRRERCTLIKPYYKIQQGAVFSGKILSFGCSVCHDDFTYSPNDLLKHFQWAHEGTLPTYPCDLCSFVTNEFPALQRHRIEHRNTLVTCELCDNDVQYSLLLLTRHYIMCHSINGQFNCDWCEFTTVDAGTFVQHIHHHNESPWKCSKCRHISLNQEDHQKHLKGHKGSFPYTCQVCGFGAAKNEFLKKHKAAVHKDEPEKKNAWKASEDSVTPANASASLKHLSGSLPNQNGKLIKSEISTEETHLFVDAKKEHKNLSKGSNNAEQLLSVMLQECDNSVSSDPAAHTNPNGLTVLRVKNKISLPPNCTTKVMGFKMVDGKKHLVLKVIQMPKQDSSTQNHSSVEEVGSSPSNHLLDTSKVSNENGECSNSKNLTSHCLALSPKSGSCIQADQDDIMAVKIKLEEEETSVSNFNSTPPRDDVREQNFTCADTLYPMTNEFDHVGDPSHPSQTTCSERSTIDENSDVTFHSLPELSNTLTMCAGKVTSISSPSKAAQETLLSKETIENCGTADELTNSSFNTLENDDQSSQNSPGDAVRAGHKNSKQHSKKLSTIPTPPSESSTPSSGSHSQNCTLSSPNQEVFTFHNYSKESFGASPNATHNFENTSDYSADKESICESSQFSLTLAESPELSLEIRNGEESALDKVSESDIETDAEYIDSFDTEDENPESVLQDFNIIKIEEDCIPISDKPPEIRCCSAFSGSFVEEHSDDIISQQLNKERVGSYSANNDSSKQTKTTLRILQLPEGKKPVLLRTAENRFAMPLQVKTTPGFKLITNTASPQINVSYMKPGLERPGNPAAVTLTQSSRIMAGKAGATEKGTRLLTAVQSGFSTSSNHYLINRRGFKGPVLFTSTPNNKKPIDKTAKTQKKCYLVQRSVPFVQTPNTPGLRLASAQHPLNSRPVLAMPVSPTDNPSNLQTGRQAFLLRYISPPKSGFSNNQDAKTGTPCSQTGESTGKVIYKIISPTSNLLTSAAPTSSSQPLFLATRPQSKCFLVSSNQKNANSSNGVMKLIPIQNTAQKDVKESLISPFQMNVKVNACEADKPILAPRSIRPPSQRKRRRKALFDELPEPMYKARRLTNKGLPEKDTVVLWKPVAKELERTLRLAPFHSLQQIKCPRRFQPVVVLNHPDADIPEVANIMKVVKRHKGAVTKVSLSQKTIQALSELGALWDNSSTKAGSSQDDGPRPRPLQSSVRERFLLKMKLRKKSKKKYEVVSSRSGCREELVSFDCWFCGRLFNNQEDWIGHGQRHLMEATRDWNKLF